MENSLAIIFGPAVSESLQNSILETLKNHGEQVEPIGVNWKNFSDGERQPQIMGNLRSKDTYIINSTQPPAQNFQDLSMLLRAANEATTDRLTAVIPYLGLARQDRKDLPRVPVGAKLMADQISVAMGTEQPKHVMVFHPHFIQLPGYFNVPVDIIYPKRIFEKKIKDLFEDFSNVVFVAPDVGASAQIKNYADRFNTQYAVVNKTRDPKTGKTVSDSIIGDVQGKHAIVIDDIGDTCGSIKVAAKALRDAGASSIRFFVTHGLFSGKCFENLDEANLDEIYTTDSINGIALPPKTEVITCGGLIGDAIYCNYRGLSLSGMLENK